MKNFTALIRVKGTTVQTSISADNAIHAKLLLQYLYGMNSIVGYSAVSEGTQPKTPEQLRIDSLKANKDKAASALKAERQRQQVRKAQKTLANAGRPIAPTV
jgi:hypothetical protein